MSIVKPQKVTVVAAVALVSGTAMTGFVSAPANAVQGSCNIGGDPYVEGRKLPVILVHGITGNPEQWRVGNLEKRIDSINNAHIAQNFSYEDKGVIAGLPTEYDMLATRLANVIDCAARKSALNGGPGKVAVVGYSLGAALTHTAASKIISGEEVSGKIGQVVTQ